MTPKPIIVIRPVEIDAAMAEKVHAAVETMLGGEYRCLVLPAGHDVIGVFAPRERC